MTQSAEGPDEGFSESINGLTELEDRCQKLQVENNYLVRITKLYEERVSDLERRNQDLFQERDNLKNYCEFLMQVCRDREPESGPRAPPNTPNGERKSLGAVSTVDEELIEPMPAYFGETLIHFKDKREGARCPSLETYTAEQGSTR
jgi:hypothetical protein